MFSWPQKQRRLGNMFKSKLIAPPPTVTTATTTVFFVFVLLCSPEEAALCANLPVFPRKIHSWMFLSCLSHYGGESFPPRNWQAARPPSPAAPDTCAVSRPGNSLHGLHRPPIFERVVTFFYFREDASAADRTGCCHALIMVCPGSPVWNSVCDFMLSLMSPNVSSDLGSGMRQGGDWFIRHALSEPSVDLLLWPEWFTDKECHRSPKQTNSLCETPRRKREEEETSTGAPWMFLPSLLWRGWSRLLPRHTAGSRVDVDLKSNYGSVSQHIQGGEFLTWEGRSMCISTCTLLLSLCLDCVFVCLQTLDDKQRLSVCSWSRRASLSEMVIRNHHTVSAH